MPLALMRNLESPIDTRDYYVTSGDLRVGRIYERPTASKPLQFLWALNGVFGGPRELLVAGSTARFEQAQAALQENWDKWLAWAKLQEIGELSTTQSDAAMPSEQPPLTAD